MARLERVRVRATITGGGLSASTPYVLSFTVKKTRGQPSTFNCSIKVPHTSGRISGEVKIYAGSDGAGNLIMTGIITKATVSPCFDDPSYVIVNMSGYDVLKTLEYKKYTRRQSATKAAWCAITGVSRKHLKSGKFKYMKIAPTLKINDGSIDFATDVGQSTDIANQNYVADLGMNVSPGVKSTGIPWQFEVITSGETEGGTG